MHIAFTANTRSGGGLDPEPLAEAMRAHGARVDVFGCEESELERLEAAAPERVAVAGGDGTVGGAAAVAGRLGVALAVIPTGTANDFARTNGIPDDAIEAAELAATGTTLRTLDLGRLADGRPFVNTAAAGLATSAAEKAAALKRRLGALAYGVGAVRAAAVGEPLRCIVGVDGREVFAGGAWQVIVAVTGAFGGGAVLGAADPGDGQLDVAVIPAGSRVALARRAWGLRLGTIAEQKGVEHHRGRLIEVGLPPDAEINVDGELRGRGLERVTLETGAYALVVAGG